MQIPASAEVCSLCPASPVLNETHRVLKCPAHRSQVATSGLNHCHQLKNFSSSVGAADKCLPLADLVFDFDEFFKDLPECLHECTF
jgi:hypothetical protein